MDALVDLQRNFLAAVREGDERVKPQLAADRRIARDLGLGIYVHAYRARLREALENDHGCLALYLGDDLWDRMCVGYIDAHPSRSRSLRQFGDHLPDYLKLTAAFAEYPQIAELAAFERRLLDCFDAADASSATWAELQAMPATDWPGLCLRFQPSLQRYRADSNSIDIWKALKADHSPPEVAASQTRNWAIWRDPERVTRFRPLDSEETAALDHFLAGGDFAGLCEILAHRHAPHAVPVHALQHLQRWAQDGWVTQWIGGSSGMPQYAQPAHGRI